MAAKFFECDRADFRGRIGRAASIKRSVVFDWRGNSILREKSTDGERPMSLAWLWHENGWAIAAYEKGGLVWGIIFCRRLCRAGGAKDGFERPRSSSKARQTTAVFDHSYTCLTHANVSKSRFAAIYIGCSIWNFGLSGHLRRDLRQGPVRDRSIFTARRMNW